MKKSLWGIVLAAMTACSLAACSTATTSSNNETTTAAAQTTAAETTEAKATEPGEVLGISAMARVNAVYHQIEAVFIEYNTEVVAPDIDGFTVEDFATADYRDGNENRPSSIAPITAVYTNNAPELRVDKTSVEGKYIVVELEPTTHCVEEDGVYKPNHCAGLCTWRLKDDTCEWIRDDFSKFKVTQNVDVLDAQGNVVVAAGEIPALDAEHVATPDISAFENKVLENFDGNNNSIYYTLYLPEDYDSSRKYPLLFNSPGNGGRLNYEQQNDKGEFVTAGAVVTRDRVAVTAAEYNKDTIIVSPQTWLNQPEDWKYDDLAAALYLVDYMKDNYSVDENRIYAIGSSYGTMLVSRMINARPDLFAGYVQYNGCWSLQNIAPDETWLSVYEKNDPESRDGMQIFKGYTLDAALEVMHANRLDDLSHAKELLRPVAEAKVPIYIWHAVNDETIAFMYGVSPYETLTELYREEGLTPAEITRLVQLRPVEDPEYWAAGIAKRHSCSKLAATYPEAIQWLFRQEKK